MIPTDDVVEAGKRLILSSDDCVFSDPMSSMANGVGAADGGADAGADVGGSVGVNAGADAASHFSSAPSAMPTDERTNGQNGYG